MTSQTPPAKTPPNIISTRTASAFDLYWAAQAEQLEQNALPAIRRAASQWGATIGALTGIFSIAALIQGRTNVADLASGYSLAVGVLVASALLSAVAAVVLAALAAQGTPIDAELTADATHRLYWQQAVKAKDRLRCSRFLAVVAVVLIAVAVGLMWYGPTRATKTSQPVLVVVQATSAKSTVCGDIVGRTRSALILREGAGLARIVPNRSIIAMSTVDSCP